MHVEKWNQQRRIFIMKELYSIMRDLLEVEYNQKSLLYILKLLEKDCSGDQKEEMRLIVNCAKY